MVLTRPKKCIAFKTGCVSKMRVIYSLYINGGISTSNLLGILFVDAKKYRNEKCINS